MEKVLRKRAWRDLKENKFVKLKNFSILSGEREEKKNDEKKLLTARLRYNWLIKYN